MANLLFAQSASGFSSLVRSLEIEAVSHTNRAHSARDFVCLCVSSKYAKALVRLSPIRPFPFPHSSGLWCAIALGAQEIVAACENRWRSAFESALQSVNTANYPFINSQFQLETYFELFRSTCHIPSSHHITP